MKCIKFYNLSYKIKIIKPYIKWLYENSKK